MELTDRQDKTEKEAEGGNTSGNNLQDNYMVFTWMDAFPQ